MKILLTSNSKILRYGEFVMADKEEGETIFDTVEDEASKKFLRDVCQENDLKTKSKATIESMIETIEAHITDSKKIHEQKEPSPTQQKAAWVAEYNDNIVEKVQDGKSQDVCCAFLVGNGIPFSKAGAVYKMIVTEAGLVVNMTEVKAKIKTWLTETVDEDEGFEDWAEVQETIDDGVKELKLDAKVIASALKSWAKANEISIPKKIKEKKDPWQLRMRKVIAGNVEITDEEILEELEGMNKDDKKLKTYISLRDFAKLVVAAQVEDEAETDDEEDDQKEAA